MRCLVTGASGFIGRHLVHTLRSHGHNVTSVGRSPLDGKHIVVPVLNSEVLAEEISSGAFDVLFHLAAAGVRPDDRDAERLQDINARLPAELVKLCADKNIGAFVMTGSCAEYAEGGGIVPRSENDPLEDKKLYGATKALGGRQALSCGQDLDVAVAVLRLFNVYGPGEAAHRLLPSLWRNIRTGNQVPMTDGRQERDFIYVADVCAALELTAQKLAGKTLESGIYNICTGITTSVRDVSLAACRAMGGHPYQLDFGAVPMRPDEIPYLVGNPHKFEAATGWRARTDLQTGLQETVRFLSEHIQ